MTRVAIIGCASVGRTTLIEKFGGADKNVTVVIAEDKSINQNTETKTINLTDRRFVYEEKTGQEKRRERRKKEKIKTFLGNRTPPNYRK